MVGGSVIQVIRVSNISLFLIAFLRMGNSDLGLALRDLPEEKGSLEPNPLEVFEDQVPRLDMVWRPSRLPGEVGFSR